MCVHVCVCPCVLSINLLEKSKQESSAYNHVARFIVFPRHDDCTLTELIDDVVARLPLAQ